jgi:hypothetical protein
VRQQKLKITAGQHVLLARDREAKEHERQKKNRQRDDPSKGSEDLKKIGVGKIQIQPTAVGAEQELNETITD